jgi:O-antigen ligase
MTKFRTAMTAAAMAALLTGSQAMAADGPLLAGKPGGVKQAQHVSKLLLIGGAALVTVIAVVIATQSSDNQSCTTACAPPTTTG